MTHLTGTMTMLRLALRRDRIWLVIWTVVLSGLLIGSTAAVDELYPTQAELTTYAETAGSSPAAVALNGPGHGLGTLGGAVVFEIGAYIAIAIALMSVFTLGRSTRVEEETGRTELLRAGVLGRHAQLTAGVVLVAGLNLVITAISVAGMVGLGLPAAGSIAFTAGLAGVGLFFGAVAAVAVQFSEQVRGAYAISGVVIAAAYALRAAGDTGDNGLSWASPFGWAQATRPFGDERWWPLAILAAGAVILVGVAVALERRRDVGAGLMPQRPGAAAASSLLLSPVGFSFRLQRLGLAGWAVGLFALGAAFGSVGQDVEGMLGDSADLQEWIAAYGSNPTDAFFGMILLILALTAAGSAISSALRVAQEESGGRSEPVLATSISRPHWLASHLVMPLIASVVITAAGGFGVGLAHGVRIGDLSEIPGMVAGALAHLPAIWLLLAVAVLLFGLALRIAPLAWAALAGSVGVSLFGSLFQLPSWAMALSPFDHTPRLPGGDVEFAPLVGLTAAAVTLIVLGAAALRRRDVG